MKKLLVVTTVQDLSVPLFLMRDVVKSLEVEFVFFDESLSDFEKQLREAAADFVYIRDPFNSNLTLVDIKRKTDLIFARFADSYFVDNLRDFGDILFEDKFAQFRRYGEFMPPTKILERIEEIDEPGTIAKKRISSRARDIVFSSADFPGGDLSDYVAQKRIDIDVEYRVYAVFGDISETVSLKSPKREGNKVKIIGAQKISAELRNFVERIIAKSKFDFVGLDIAQSGKSFYLLEANRSCLFGGYFRQTGINLAAVFAEKLLSRPQS